MKVWNVCMQLGSAARVPASVDLVYIVHLQSHVHVPYSYTQKAGVSSLSTAHVIASGKADRCTCSFVWLELAALQTPVLTCIACTCVFGYRQPNIVASPRLSSTASCDNAHG